MISRGQEYEDKQKNETNQNLSADSANKAKLRRNLKELDRLYNNHSKSTWSTIALATLERYLGEIVRTFTKLVSSIKKNIYIYIHNVLHILYNYIFQKISLKITFCFTLF